MEIIKKRSEKELSIKLVGELNSSTALELEEVIKNELRDVNSLIFDFSDLDYLSSAGLRVLLVSQKIMNKQGTMLIKNVNEQIMEIFNITGFLNILTIQN